MYVAGVSAVVLWCWTDSSLTGEHLQISVSRVMFTNELNLLTYLFSLIKNEPIFPSRSPPAAEFTAVDSGQFRAITGWFQMKTEAGFNLLGVIRERVLIPSAQHWMFYSLKSTPVYYLQHTSTSAFIPEWMHHSLCFTSFLRLKDLVRPKSHTYALLYDVL